MKNTLGDLNNHLFAQLERLGDEDLTEEELIREINRSKAITDVANQIVSNGSLVLKAKMAYDETFDANKEKPKMLEA
jgi:hypothetical protein